jgi:hypothetical protein
MSEIRMMPSERGFKEMYNLITLYAQFKNPGAIFDLANVPETEINNAQEQLLEKINFLFVMKEIQPGDKTHNYPNLQLRDGKWSEFEGMELGEVGRTDRVNGGVAITKFSETTAADVNTLTHTNPLNGEVTEFKRTQKNTGFYNKKHGVLIKPYMVEREDDQS